MDRSSVDKWQPIETAPTDGTPILMFISDARREKDKIQVGTRHINATGNIMIVVGNQFAFDVGKITHWMPLPQEPKT